MLLKAAVKFKKRLPFDTLERNVGGVLARSTQGKIRKGASALGKQRLWRDRLVLLFRRVVSEGF